MPTYTVQQGDCISSIAHRYGFLWTTIWNHPSNGDLRQLRQDPNVLYPGDKLFIPDRTPKELPRPTEQRHKFLKKGDSAKLKILLLDQDVPRAGVPYTLVIDGKTISGTTDSNGYVRQPLPPNARSGKLLVGEGTTKDTFDLQFGFVDPVEQDSGVHGRLIDLGFGGDNPKEAIKAFQKKQALNVTGDPDDDTRAQLKGTFGQ